MKLGEELAARKMQKAQQIFNQGVECALNRDYVSAAKYLEKAAAYGHSDAESNLGYLYINGLGVDQDASKAFSLFLASAKHGNNNGMRNVAHCYLDGNGTERDVNTAMYWLSTAAGQQDALACADLASLYGDSQYKNVEKELYWLKKAAGYGHADSMYRLGEYYVRRGTEQDTQLAMNYYNAAAKSGDPAIKLQVAKALDCRWRGREPLNLSQAEQLYNEVLDCDQLPLKLDAAWGLDTKMDKGNKILRDAFDMTKAYRILAPLAIAEIDNDCCYLIAYCNEMGKGTKVNLDLAITFYEKAKDWKNANRCKAKKDQDLKERMHQSIYQEHLSYQMPPVKRSIHSPSFEYYSKDVYCYADEYDGRIYYVNKGYLCSSDLGGQDIKIITDLPDDFSCDSNVHVNVTGIYLYYYGFDYLQIWHYTFDGQLVGGGSEVRREGEEEFQTSSPYFYDNRVYYVYDCGKICQIKCMYIDDNHIEVLYRKAASIDRLFATEKKLIFLATYENDECESSEKRGWMILDLAHKTVECLSNPYCSYENVIDDPEVYDTENPRYQSQCEYDRGIQSFDLNRGIFWDGQMSPEEGDSAYLWNSEYWVPHALWGDRDAIIADLPIWKHTSLGCNLDYFDGIHYYRADAYWWLDSLDKYGRKYPWSNVEWKHGECDKFIVTGGYLFLDVDAYGIKQYPLTLEKGEPLQKAWFQDPLPEDLVEAFQNGGATPTKEETKKAVDDAPQIPYAHEEKPDGPNGISSSPDTRYTVPKKSEPTDSQSQGRNLYTEKTIGETDIKYSICTLGAKFHIGFGMPVLIRVNQNTYSAKTHKTVKGRVDGMKKVYVENGIGLGDRLRVSYLADEGVIELVPTKDT